MAQYCYLFEEVLFSIIIFYSVKEYKVAELPKTMKKFRHHRVSVLTNKCIKKNTKKYITSFKTPLKKKFISLLNFFFAAYYLSFW